MILVVVGTRAELIKVFPIMHELDRQGVVWEWIATGQHDLSEEIKEFGVKKPLTILYPFKRRSVVGAFLWVFETVRRLRAFLKRVNPAAVLVHGDTLSTLVGTLSAKFPLSSRFTLIHVEAGLRSGNFFEPLPEEAIRVVCDRLSDVLFAPHQKAFQNLKKEGVKGKVFVVGNSFVDSVKFFLRGCRRSFQKDYVVVTIHRFENIRRKSDLKFLVSLLRKLPFYVVWVYKKHLKKTLSPFLNAVNCTSVEELPYSKFICLLYYSKAAITDSGGVSEECFLLSKPCIVFRRRTERQEVLERGVGISAFGKSYEEILDFIENFSSSSVRHPYGKNPSKKIVSLIKKVVL